MSDTQLSPLFVRKCDSTTHDPIGFPYEDGSVKHSSESVDPVDHRCLDWHPDLNPATQQKP